MYILFIPSAVGFLIILGASVAPIFRFRPEQRNVPEAGPVLCDAEIEALMRMERAG